MSNGFTSQGIAGAVPNPTTKFNDIITRLQDIQSVVRRSTHKIDRLYEQLVGPTPTAINSGGDKVSAPHSVIGCFEELHRDVAHLEAAIDRFHQS